MDTCKHLIKTWEDIQLEEFQKFLTLWGFSSSTLNIFLREPQGSDKWLKLREKALNVWFNYQRRLIKPNKRKILPNPILSCPAEVQDGWQMLQNEVENGTDLTPRLSRKIEDADYNDAFLNDWGFHHFHLGVAYDEKHPRQMKRTDFVLAAVVDAVDFYPISFIRHRRWNDQSILETAVAAFPERFECYRLKGVTDVSMAPSNDDTELLRKAGVSCIRKIGEGVYFPPGLGLTSARTSLAATMDLDRHRRRLAHVETSQKHSCNKQ